jgi:hypothetical protein
MDVTKQNEEVVAQIAEYRRAVRWHLLAQWFTLASIVFFTVGAFIAYL